MDIQDLKVFTTVAKYGNISKAAEELKFVQSSVTNKIKKLEEHFQSPLFHRHRNGVSLTSAGQVLLTYSNNIIRLATEAENSIVHGNVPNGPLSIGCVEAMATLHLSAALASFHKRYPEVELTFLINTSQEIIEGVLNNKIDGGVVSCAVPNPDLVQRHLWEEELVVVYKAGQENNLDYENTSVIVHKKGCTFRNRLEEWLYTKGIKANKIIECSSLETIISCVSAGAGISLLPRSIICHLNKHSDITCLPIDEQYNKAPMVFIHRKDAINLSSLQKFVEIIGERVFARSHD